MKTNLLANKIQQYRAIFPKTNVIHNEPLLFSQDQHVGTPTREYTVSSLPTSIHYFATWPYYMLFALDSIPISDFLVNEGISKPLTEGLEDELLPGLRSVLHG